MPIFLRRRFSFDASCDADKMRRHVSLFFQRRFFATPAALPLLFAGDAERHADAFSLLLTLYCYAIYVRFATFLF